MTEKDDVKNLIQRVFDAERILLNIKNAKLSTKEVFKAIEDYGDKYGVRSLWRKEDV